MHHGNRPAQNQANRIGVGGVTGVEAPEPAPTTHVRACARRGEALHKNKTERAPVGMPRGRPPFCQGRARCPTAAGEGGGGGGGDARCPLTKPAAAASGLRTDRRGTARSGPRRPGLRPVPGLQALRVQICTSDFLENGQWQFKPESN
jgi:hypothetical protein